MFNRRFLRIKVFHALYAFQQDEHGIRSAHEKNLLKSLDKAFELYIFLLAFPSEFKFYLDKDLGIQIAKHFPDKKVIADIRSLIDNKLLTLFEESEFLKEKYKAIKVKWTQTDDLFRTIFTELRESKMFDEYISKNTHTFAEDKKAFIELFEILIGNSETFNQYIEEHFINWEDDQVLVTLALIKTIQAVKESNETDFVLNFEQAEEEDLKFMKLLFHQTIDHDDELLKLIADKTKNWEADRIAIVDMLLMKMALCEILQFPLIPVKVSINEYLELAKLYSTPNSHGFINGVLDKIHLDLRNANKIEKQGRGLVE